MRGAGGILVTDFDSTVTRRDFYDLVRLFDAATGVNKPAVVRDALQRSDVVAFAGDGRPDLEPSLLVPPARRFARQWLAGALDERGDAYHPMENWTVLRDTLLC